MKRRSVLGGLLAGLVSMVAPRFAVAAPDVPAPTFDGVALHGIAHPPFAGDGDAPKHESLVLL